MSTKPVNKSFPMCFCREVWWLVRAGCRAAVAPILWRWQRKCSIGPVQWPGGPITHLHFNFILTAWHNQLSVQSYHQGAASQVPATLGLLQIDVLLLIFWFGKTIKDMLSHNIAWLLKYPEHSTNHWTHLEWACISIIAVFSLNSNARPA